MTADGDAGAPLQRSARFSFACAGSVRQTAHALDVHENTVRYRLARMEKLTGLDIANDSDTQLRMQLALAVLRLQGRLC